MLQNRGNFPRLRSHFPEWLVEVKECTPKMVPWHLRRRIFFRCCSWTSPFYTSSRVDCSSAHVAKWAKRSLEECRIMVGMDVFYYGMAWYGMLLWYSLEECSIMLGQKGNWWTKWPSPASQSVTSRTWGDGKTCCQKYQHFFQNLKRRFSKQQNCN